MKKNFKIISLVLCLCLIVTSMAGCTSTSTQTTQTSETKTAETTVDALAKYQPVQGKTYEISWLPMTQPVDEDGAIVNMIEEKFHVKFKMWDTTQGTALNIRIAAGEIPDSLAYAPLLSYQQFKDDNVIAEIPLEALKAMAPDLYQLYLSDTPGAIEALLLDGKLYALPVPDSEAGGIRHSIIYRGDWMQKVGVAEAPKTLDELEKLMYKFANEDPDGNGKKDTYGLSENVMELVYGAYGALPNIWVKRDGKITHGSIQPEMKEALSILRKWYADKVLDPEFITGENRGVAGSGTLSVPFASGITGAFSESYYHFVPSTTADGKIAYTGLLGEINTNFPGAAEKIVYANPPAGPNGKKGVYTNPYMHSWLISFGKQVEKEPDKMGVMLQIYNFANATFDGFMNSRYGFVGEHWEWLNGVKEGTVVQLKGLDASWMDQTLIGGGICFTPLWFYSIQKRINKNLKWVADKPYYREDGYLNAVYLPLPSDEKVKAELDKIQKEAYIAIITGTKPLDYFDEFVSTWKNSGGDTLIAEANARGN